MVTIALSSLLKCWRREFFKVKAVSATSDDHRATPTGGFDFQDGVSYYSVQWCGLRFWSYYKAAVSDQQNSVLVLVLLAAVLVYGLGLVNYDLGVEKFPGAFRWQLRKAHCRTPTNIPVCLIYSHVSAGDLQHCSYCVTECHCRWQGPYSIRIVSATIG